MPPGVIVPIFNQHCPMKTLAKISLVALGLAACIPAYAAARDKAADKLAHHPRLRAALQRRAAVRAAAAKKLDLTDDQKAQLKTKRQDTVAALKALRNDPNLTKEQKKEKAKELIQSARNEVRSALTPEQKKKAQAMRERLKERLQRNKTP